MDETTEKMDFLVKLQDYYPEVQVPRNDETLEEIKHTYEVLTRKIKKKEELIRAKDQYLIMVRMIEGYYKVILQDLSKDGLTQIEARVINRIDSVEKLRERLKKFCRDFIDSLKDADQFKEKMKDSLDDSIKLVPCESGYILRGILEILTRRSEFFI